jgi:hypothetical protein
MGEVGGGLEGLIAASVVEGGLTGGVAVAASGQQHCARQGDEQ